MQNDPRFPKMDMNLADASEFANAVKSGLVKLQEGADAATALLNGIILELLPEGADLPDDWEERYRRAAIRALNYTGALAMAAMKTTIEALLAAQKEQAGEGEEQQPVQ